MTSNVVAEKSAEKAKPEEVVWHEHAPEGKLDLLVTLDFRMSTTCLYSDIVLPTATWYEKNDLNTSDMHPFIHPLSTAVDPAWQSRSDWDIYKGIAEAFSRVAPEVLGVEKDVVLTPEPGRGTIGVKWSYGGQVIDQPEKEVSYRDAAATSFNLVNSGGFPPGNYTVEVFVDGQSAGTRNFNVQ